MHTLTATATAVAPPVYAPRPRVWVAPVVRPYYGAGWRGPARGHDMLLTRVDAQRLGRSALQP